MEELKKEKKFKLAFIFGLLTGIAIFGLISFILLMIKNCYDCVLAKKEIVKQEETQKEIQKEIQQNQNLGMEAKIVNRIGTFYEVDEPICKKDGKPLIFMFSTSWCPHCRWVKPLYEEVVKEYIKKKKIIAYQWELDTNDDTLTPNKENEVNQEHLALYEKYNPNQSIPTFIFGCKYYRIGTGYERENNPEAEKKEFRELIEKLLKES
jgi:thiol-disulfide isomerase/thioredoxin